MRTCITDVRWRKRSNVKVARRIITVTKDQPYLVTTCTGRRHIVAAALRATQLVYFIPQTVISLLSANVWDKEVCVVCCMGCAGAPPPFGWGHGWPLKRSPSPYVLPRQTWSFCDKGYTHKWKGTPKIGKWGPTRLWWDVSANPVEIRPSPHVTQPNLVVLGQTVWALLNRSVWKFCAFRGCSRSMEPTGIDQRPRTSY